MQKQTAFALACGLTALLAGAGAWLLSPIAGVVFAVAFVGGLVAWRRTTYGRPAPPDRLVVPYLLTVLLFIVHVGEEYATGFWSALGGLTGLDVSRDAFVLVAVLVGPALWLSGLVLLYLRTEIGNWLAWVFVVAMTVSELAHFVFPFLAPGPLRYFPGLLTAALPLVPASVLAVRLARSGRASS